MYTPLRRYYRGADLLTMRDVQAGVNRHYHFDHQGTTQCLTDDTGAVTDRFSSDAWGVQVKRTGTSINRHWYIGNLGYYRSPGSGSGHHDYVRERVVSAAAGRWLQKDPDGPPPTPYAYGRNSPILYVDPSGRVCSRVPDTRKGVVQDRKAAIERALTQVLSPGHSETFDKRLLHRWFLPRFCGLNWCCVVLDVQIRATLTITAKVHGETNGGACVPSDPRPGENYNGPYSGPIDFAVAIQQTLAGGFYRARRRKRCRRLGMSCGRTSRCDFLTSSSYVDPNPVSLLYRARGEGAGTRRNPHIRVRDLRILGAESVQLDRVAALCSIVCEAGAAELHCPEKVCPPNADACGEPPCESPQLRPRGGRPDPRPLDSGGGDDD